MKQVLFYCLTVPRIRERNEDSLQRKRGDGLFETIGERSRKSKGRGGGDNDAGSADFAGFDDGIQWDCDGGHDECGHYEVGEPGGAFAGYA